MTLDKPPADKRVLQDGKGVEALHHPPSQLASEVKAESEEVEDDEARESKSESESDEPPSPRSQPHLHVHARDAVKVRVEWHMTTPELKDDGGLAAGKRTDGLHILG